MLFLKKWHSDGDHLSEDVQLPPYCLNVFVPLIDVPAAVGPTEFVPTSHMHWGTAETPVVLTANAGQCIIFDHRLKHRGLANKSALNRPLVSGMHCRFVIVIKFFGGM